jgi:DNA-directed RNA polymerase sigma subunit (sigma70/sigma32)
MVGLPGNYYAVLRLRSWNYTLDEVGKLMGVTRERVRQIEKQAILKLRKEIEQINPHMASAFDGIPARFSPATKTRKQ